MAFLKELRVKCHYDRRCTKETVVQAFDNQNRESGMYCRKHGTIILEGLQKQPA